MRLIIPLSILLLINYGSFAQDVKGNYRATSEEIFISIDNDSIAAFGLFAAGETKKETVILLHGIPGNERNLDLAQAIRKNGRNVIYFNYRGSWGSQGKFMYSNCLQDVKEIMDFFDKPENSKRYRIKQDSYILFGHSTGGGLALLSGAKDRRVKQIGMYSPWNVTLTKKAEFIWLEGYLKGLFMLNINAKEFVSELEKNIDEYDPLHYSEELGNKKVLILDENDRNRSWVEQIQNVQYVLVDTDHSFSDKRSELIEVVSGWLNN
ncbi:MAG: alpha/beta fold hydrolase [Bacteroidota bacterium]